MLTPFYKNMKTNGTTMYVFPSVAEDKNFAAQNDNYNMYMTHYALVNIPRQDIAKGVLDLENTFQQNLNDAPVDFKAALVESLRNYVANHESVIRNSKLNSSEYYYDVMELETTTEKIFWKWARKIGIIDFEPADITQEYFAGDTKYADNGPTGNLDYFREYLWKERSNTIYDFVSVNDSISNPATNKALIVLTASTTLKPSDYVTINFPGLDGLSNSYSKVEVLAVTTTGTLNDTIEVQLVAPSVYSDIMDLPNRTVVNSYERFVKFISEITGTNNVQLPDKAYTETHAVISHQHGQTPYCLWNVKNDNNYKPNLQFPILPNQLTEYIQGGENPNNPISLDINNVTYPGSVYAHFDITNKYTSSVGNVNKRSGDYYGVLAVNNTTPTLKWPDFDGSNIDGMCLNLNINDYAQAVGYALPIESFAEFSSTSFNNIAPLDFEYNAILWYYTIEDVTGNNANYATNLYGIQFLDTPDNDIDIIQKNKIPSLKKLVSNGYQDGTGYVYALDSNIEIENNVEPPSFDPDKVYSLFGMDLFYEALTRLTYFNDSLTYFVTNSLDLKERVDNLTGLVYNQQSLESIRSKMNNLENLLNVYSTLQIGNSDSIIPRLDTSVNPPLVRLESVDKKYGNIYSYNTKNLFTEFINLNAQTEYSVVKKTIPVVSGKDFLVLVNNNDNNEPTPAYDTTIEQLPLEITLEKDLFYKQTVDFIIQPLIVDTVNNIYPINDKHLKVNINYNDGLNTEKIELFNLPLPVLNYFRPDTYTIDYKFEPHYNLNTLPKWQVRNVFYSKQSEDKARLSFVIEDDLMNFNPAYSTNNNGLLNIGARVLIDNLLINSDPSTNDGTYINLSNQYKLTDNNSFNPQYVRSQVVDVYLTATGTAATGTYSAIPSVPSVQPNDVLVDVYYDSPTQTISLLNCNRLLTPEIVEGLTFTLGSGTNFKLAVKTVSKIFIDVDTVINENLDILFNTYDTHLGITTSSNPEVLIDKYLKIMPTVSFCRGYKVSLTRITENENILNTLFNQRYNIKIDNL